MLPKHVGRGAEVLEHLQEVPSPRAAPPLEPKSALHSLVPESPGYTSLLFTPLRPTMQHTLDTYTTCFKNHCGRKNEKEGESLACRVRLYPRQHLFFEIGKPKQQRAWLAA